MNRIWSKDLDLNTGFPNYWLCYLGEVTEALSCNLLIWKLWGITFVLSTRLSYCKIILF